MSRLTQGHRAAVEAIESATEVMTVDGTTDAAKTDEETTVAQGDTRTTPILLAATTENASARIGTVAEIDARIEVDGRTGLLARTGVDPGHQEEVDVTEMVGMIGDETAVMSLVTAGVVVVAVAEIATIVVEETTERRAHRLLPRSANLHQTLPMWSPSSIESAA